MPKTGRYDYPGIDIENADTRLRKIFDVTKKMSNTRPIAIKALGLSEMSGQAQLIVASLDKYGLAETGGNSIRITNLGERVLFAPTEDEKIRAMKEAVMNVDLFKDIVETYGPEPTDQQLNIFLQQTANTDLRKLAEATAGVRNMLNNNRKYLEPVESLQPSLGEGQGIDRRSEELPEIQTSAVVEIRPESGPPYSFPLDNLELAKSLVDSVLDDMIKRRKDQPKEPPV
jgi:hypothetical protein